MCVCVCDITAKFRECCLKEKESTQIIAIFSWHYKLPIHCFILRRPNSALYTFNKCLLNGHTIQKETPLIKIVHLIVGFSIAFHFKLRRSL